MALVSYGINNSSDEEDEQNQPLQNTAKPMIASAIPPPKSWSSPPNDISVLERNLTRPVRILAPPLQHDVEERPRKIVKSTIGNALVSILPEPKYSKNGSEMAEQGCKKNPRDNKLEQPVDSTVGSRQRNSGSGKVLKPSFFFTSLNEDQEGDRFDYETEFYNHIHASDVQQYVTSEYPPVQSDLHCADTAFCTPLNHVDEKPKPSSSLNTDALIKLCGSQGKNLTSNKINLIEIDGSELVNSAEMQTNNVKSLTYDYNSLYRQHKFKSSRRERSKHQITYLVEHAKFFEREVSNYPKNSKISQKRYGF